MAVNLNVNGIVYRYPSSGDTNWGQIATLWAQAITSGVLQKAGGTFTLTSDVDFGANFGLLAPYFTSRIDDPSTAGVLRLASGDAVSWRNNANDGNVNLAINFSDNLTFNGDELIPISVSDTSKIDLTLTAGEITGTIVADSLVNADINSAAAITYSKLNLAGSILNTDINASAAIAYSKLASLTASRALATSAGGVIEVSAVTATQLGYLSTSTSNIQTQLDAKLSKSGGTMTGNLLLSADPTLSNQAATKLYVDNAVVGLQVKTPVATASTGNLTLSGEQTIDGVLTSTDRVLAKNQSAPAENGVYVTAAGAWARSSDLNEWDEFIQAYVFVEAGSTQAGASYLSDAVGGGTLGTTAIAFNQFSSAVSITTDNEGIAISGTQVSLVLDGTTLSKSGSGLTVNEINNAEIGASAAIALSKLETVTASRVLVSDGSGEISTSSVTPTTLGYLDATSSIQTQINTKITNPMTTNGDIIVRAAGVPARLPIGTEGYILKSVSSSPVWSNPNVNPTIVAGSTGATLTAADTNKTFFVDASSARNFQLPAPAAGLNFRFKDSTGQANTNNITLLRNASEQIEGIAGNKVLQTNWGSWEVMSDGTNWFIF